MDFQSLFTVCCAFAAIITALLSFILVMNVFSAQKTANNRILGMQDTYNTLKLAFERVDQEQIKKMLTELSEIETDNQKTRSAVDLLDGKVTSFVNRNSAQHPRKKGTTEEPEEPALSKDEDMIETLKKKGLAIPMVNNEEKTQETGPARLVRASSIK